MTSQFKQHALISMYWLMFCESLQVLNLQILHPLFPSKQPQPKTMTSVYVWYSLPTACQQDGLYFFGITLGIQPQFCPEKQLVRDVSKGSFNARQKQLEIRTLSQTCFSIRLAWCCEPISLIRQSWWGATVLSRNTQLCMELARIISPLSESSERSNTLARWLPPNDTQVQRLV